MTRTNTYIDEATTILKAATLLTVAAWMKRTVDRLSSAIEWATAACPRRMTFDIFERLAQSICKVLAISRRSRHGCTPRAQTRRRS